MKGFEDVIFEQLGKSQLYVAVDDTDGAFKLWTSFNEAHRTKYVQGNRCSESERSIAIHHALARIDTYHRQ